MFQDRHWPEGFEFPACEGCNAGTRDDDLLIAMLARIDAAHNRGDLDGKLPGLMARAHDRHPGMFEKAVSIGDDDDKWNITEEMRQAVAVLAASSPRASTIVTRRQSFPTMAAW